MRLPLRRRGQEPPEGEPSPEEERGSERPAEDGEPAAAEAKPDKASWEFEEGAPIAEGRTILKRLGGGSRYEVHLVWDGRLFAIMVAKLLRPDQVEDERALRELGQEAEALERLATPCWSAASGRFSMGPTRTS